MEELMMMDMQPEVRRVLNTTFGCSIGLLLVGIPYSAYNIYKVFLKMGETEKHREALNDPNTLITSASQF